MPAIWRSSWAPRRSSWAYPTILFLALSAMLSPIYGSGSTHFMLVARASNGSATCWRQGRVWHSFFAVAQSAPAGAHRLLFLPFLMGERGARGGGAPGAFVGLTTEHRSADLIRAVLEGVAFELRRLQQRRGTPLPTDVLTLKGGGAQNELWCQIVSGVLGIPYRTTQRDAAYGAAMTAGVSQGWWSGWQSVPALTDPINESGLADVEILNDRTRGTVRSSMR